MKALTLTQPWAQLVVDGRKRFETRSWYTRGPAGHDRWRPFPIAIHAAKGWSLDDREFARSLGYDPATMARGAMLGFAVVRSILSTDCYVFLPDFFLLRFGPIVDPGVITIPASEFEVGDFGRGRFAWELTEVRRFDEPIPARGALGLWEWTP